MQDKILNMCNSIILIQPQYHINEDETYYTYCPICFSSIVLPVQDIPLKKMDDIKHLQSCAYFLALEIKAIKQKGD